MGRQMTKDEARVAFNEAKAAFHATIEELFDGGLREHEIWDHEDYLNAGDAKWAAFDVWQEMEEGK